MIYTLYGFHIIESKILVKYEHKRAHCHQMYSPQMNSCCLPISIGSCTELNSLRSSELRCCAGYQNRHSEATLLTSHKWKRSHYGRLDLDSSEKLQHNLNCTNSNLKHIPSEIVRSLCVLIHMNEGYKTSRVFLVIVLKQDSLYQLQMWNSEILGFDTAVAKTAWNISLVYDYSSWLLLSTEERNSILVDIPLPAGYVPKWTKL